MDNHLYLKTITIIGLGLLGGSVARATKQFFPQIHIKAYDSCVETRQKAQALGIVDDVFDDIQGSVVESDMVIISAPLGVFGEIAQKIIPCMKKGSILTDTGSVKGAVIDAIAPYLYLNPDIYFVPAHPIAGTENSGIDAGFASLFQNRKLVITPLETTDNNAIEIVKSFFQAFGSVTEIMTPKHHDLVFAIVSHIPHLIAFNIVGTANHLEQVSEQEVIRFSASGFRDFTRLASSDPIIWRDVFLNNREAVLEMLGRFIEDLFDVQRAIRYSDGDKLEALFRQTRSVRQKIIDAGQEIAKPNFGRNE